MIRTSGTRTAEVSIGAVRDRTRLRRLSVPLNTATGTPDLADSTATNDRRPAFRADIEGLRALAVLLVVLYHSAFPGFSGGYVGVDVFFVISGYLITGTLLREASATSTIRMSRFWASRIRRLVPALTVMVIVTWIAGLAIQSPLGWSDLAREGMSAATYTSNILFAREAGGYFASTGSPFLHTWSLSVEEQFYIGWPILALVAVKVFPSRTGRRGWESRLRCGDGDDGLVCSVHLGNQSRDPVGLTSLLRPAPGSSVSEHCWPWQALGSPRWADACR